MTPLGPLLSAELASVAPTAIGVATVAAGGVLGVMDSIFGEEEQVPDDAQAGGGGGDLFEEGGGGGGGDEFAFDEGGGGGGGEFDDFDMGGAEGEDGVDGGGGAGGNYAELDGRVDELEAELEKLSSTVSTVRTENEQIGESVEEVEENVRKLLDIYKMVTKGVNPFVDEGGVDQFAGGGSLGIFDEDGGEEPDDLDDDVADADAEEFFEEDLEDDDGGAKSFDDLREQYEEGDAEWNDDELEGEEDLEEDEEELEGDEDALEGDEAELEEDEEVEEDEAESEAESDDDEAAETESNEGAAFGRPATAPAPAARDGDAGKPYLETVPAGFAADLVALEWMEFLVSESSPAGADRAIAYYQRVDWITDRAADQLRAYLDGHPASARADRDGSGDAGSLSMTHHTTSLRYVARLDGDLGSAALGEGSRRARR